MQGIVREDIPVVQIHVLQTEEIKAGEVRSRANNCMLISNPAKYFYEDLGTLFINLKPRDNEIGQPYLDSVTIVEPCDNTIGLGKYADRPYSSSKRSPSKFLNLLDARVEDRKKTDIISERPAGFDGIVVRRGVIKSEDHG